MIEWAVFFLQKSFENYPFDLNNLIIIKLLNVQSAFKELCYRLSFGMRLATRLELVLG